MKPIRCHSGNLAKHGVSEREVMEVFGGVHLRLRNPAGAKGTYLAIGKSVGGRFLELVFEDRGHYWWVFHAMTARPRLVRFHRRRMRQYGR